MRKKDNVHYHYRKFMRLANKAFKFYGAKARFTDSGQVIVEINKK